MPIITYSNDTLFSSPAYAYQWYFNTLLIPGATDSFYVTTQLGNYYVLIFDTNGCGSASNQIAVGIEKFDPDSYRDGLKFEVLPNPNDGSFVITTDDLFVNELEISIFNYLGEKVYSSAEKNIKGNFSKEINLSTLPEGIYVIRIATNEFAGCMKVFITPNSGF